MLAAEKMLGHVFTCCLLMRGEVPDAYRSQAIWFEGPQPESVKKVRFIREKDYRTYEFKNHSSYDDSWSLLAVTSHGFSASAEGKVFMVIIKPDGVVAPKNIAYRLGPINNEVGLSLKLSPGDILDVVEGTFLSMPISDDTLTCLDGGCELKSSTGQSFIVDGVQLRKIISRK
jgi:hypothetical protein